MTNPNLCSACGCELPADAPAGLCPKCLLAAGFESGPIGDPPIAATTPPPAGASVRFVPPLLAELNHRLPQYEFLELLGQGGMGAVYKARQKGLDRLVAVKILAGDISGDAAFAERFAREARALARLSHANIVAVYDYGKTEGAGVRGQGSEIHSSSSPLTPDVSPLFFIAMEYVDGVNLRQAIRGKQMTPEQALAVVPQICDALQFAHDEGVVHRDIKPENILVDKRGRVKIADFGLAKMLGGEQLDTALTGAHQVMGTLRYMAPEQMEGTHEVDHRADIYSLGVVFYELLTGELPIGRFAPPSKKVQIDVRLDEVVLRALEKEPELRWQHASDVKTEVATIVGSRGGVISTIPAAALGREYRSRASLLGIPLVHIAFGIDPATGKKRVAKGIFAMGDTAVGLVAMGGTAYGGICFGGAAFGLICCGGLSLGLLISVGGVAIGGIAWGGLAVGAVALGGLALGGYCYGGVGYGASVLASNAEDPAAKALFEPWAHQWPLWMTALSVGGPLCYLVAYGMAWWTLYRQEARSRAQGRTTQEPRFSRTAIVGAVWAPCFLLLAGVLMPTTAVISQTHDVVATSSDSDAAPGATTTPTQTRAPIAEPAPPRSGMAGWLIALAVVAGIVGITAPFGTTILGMVAIGQIRRSQGKLYGLPLAVGDAVLFPLLLLDGIIIWVAAMIPALLGLPRLVQLAVLLGLPVVAWIDYCIVRAVWRAAARRDG